MNDDSKNASPRGRRRRVADTDLVEAALTIVLKDGLARLTFARLAAAVGMVPASLAHRFGSRENLIVEVSRAITSRIEARSAEAAAGAGGLSAVEGFLIGLLPPDAEPSTVINQLALLQIELENPRLRGDVARRSLAVRSALVQMLTAAALGEISGVGPERLADMVQSLLIGAQLCWSMRPEGSLRDKVAGDLALLLDRFAIPGR